MPLLELKRVGPERWLGLYKIEESYADLLHALDPPAGDREMLETYSNVQKRCEWLAARTLLRLFCDAMEIEYYGTRKDSNGKPFLQGHAFEISLSHSFPYVAFIADKDKEVGIDLEQPKEKLRQIAPRFLSERELLLSGDNLNALCTFWCCKEALYKIYSKKGLNFKEEIHLYPNEEYPWKYVSGIISKNSEETRHQICCEYGSDYILAYNA